MLGYFVLFSVSEIPGCGDCNPRVRRCQSPRAALGISAGGVFKPLLRGLYSERFAYHFVVVEVVFHPLNYLIIFMSLACHEDYIARLCHCAGGADGFPAVHDADDAAPLTAVEACQHIVYYLLRVFVARVVARNNDTVAVLDGFLRHEGALALVPVAASAADRPALAFALASGVWA